MVVAAGDFGIKLAFVIGFGALLGAVVLLPWTIDVYYAEKKRGAGETPKGLPGLSRASMALSVLIVVSFALAYLLVEHPLANNARTVGDIVVALTTTLAAISAFYFGTKAAEKTPTETARPAISITKPVEGRHYHRGARVRPKFDASGSYHHLESSVNGGPIDTSTAGPHIFAVSARAADGQELAAKSIEYVVDP